MPADFKHIRLLLVDDHPLVREGLRSCLAHHEHLDIIGEAADGWQAIQKARELWPDIILMDLNLPNLSGLDATIALRKELPDIKVLILTIHDKREYVLEISRSGAHGYVLKEASPQELVQAIEAVDRGEAFFSPKIAQFVLTDYVERAGKPEQAPIPMLSARERQVLALIAEGCRNKEIAGKLSVGVRTVETHRERIMRKLDIHNVAGLTKFAIAKKITELE
jgi:two-component system nitrate/nitrite response regulator NarL